MLCPHIRPCPGLGFWVAVGDDIVKGHVDTLAFELLDDGACNVLHTLWRIQGTERE